MKKICALIIISFLFITSLTVYGGTTLTEPLGGTTSEGLVWCYNNESRSEIWIIGFDSRIIPESVTIPVEITRWSIILQKDVTAPVTRICFEAFKHCNQIKDIKIPKGITAIDAWAFGFCPNLTSVELPEGLKVISDWTFYKCEKLANITLPSTITNIGKGAFSDCKELSEMIIPPNVTAIETQAFSHCTSLSRFLIPESVTKMGESSPVLNVPYAVIDSSVLPTDSEVPAIEIYGVPGSYIEEYANEFEHFAFKPVSEYPNNTADNDVISVTVNDKNIVFDQPPIIENDRTLVPVRAIFEAMGADVQWDGNTRTVIATKGATEISLQIDSVQMYVNSDIIYLDVPAKIINNRTLVPVRAVSEAFGCKVNWIQDTKTVVIIQ